MEELRGGQAGVMSHFAGRVGVVQRVLPGYRAPLFDLLAVSCRDGLSVFAGQPRSSEAIGTSETLKAAEYSPARNWHLFGGALYLCWQGGLLSWLDAWQPDALIVEANPRYLSTPGALRWMKARGRTVLGWGLGAPSAKGPLGSLRRARRRNFLKSFDGLVAYSRGGAAEYRALGFPAKRIYVAPNAVTPRPKGPLPKQPTNPEGKAVVLFVGRLQTRKRLGSLLRAVANLPAAIQPKLQIVGDGPARAELERLAAGVYPTAEFTGALYGEVLAARFRAADLFVLPGTGGLAVQQAMAHGLPVIVAEGDGTQTDLVTPQNGWRLPPGDEGALRKALEMALSDPGRLRKMGQESYRMVKEEFNLENMVAMFVKALNEVSG